MVACGSRRRLRRSFCFCGGQDRAGVKATFTENYSRQSKCTFGAVLEEITTRDESGAVRQPCLPAFWSLALAKPSSALCGAPLSIPTCG